MLLAVLPPVSNRADWILNVEVRADDSNDLIDLTDYTIEIQVVHQDDCVAVLSATTADDTITLPQLGQFQTTFTAAQMGGIDPDTYDLGVIATLDDSVTQLIIGTVPVLEGHVR